MTLFGDFLGGNHRRSHKWYQYFPAYERHFERFRNRHVTLFEIGLGEGGSLQQWQRYLGPFARIVGIDIEPMCMQLEQDEIHVRIGSQDDTAFLAQVVAEFGHPDIVIDDGSHLMPHINTTFDFLFPLVAKNGVYLVEDLHAAYWEDHGGGLRHPASFIERAKGFVDEMHAEYSNGKLERSTLGDRTTSIHFYDSVVVMEVGEYRPKRHRITGDPELFRLDWTPGSPPPDTSQKASVADQLNREREAVRAAVGRINEMQGRLESLEAEIGMLRGSTSWRITQPLRTMGRLVRR